MRYLFLFPMSNKIFFFNCLSLHKPEVKFTSKKEKRNMTYRPDAQENTRLFILAGKGVKEETFREKFEQYGKIEDLWIVKDKRTNEDKGTLFFFTRRCLVILYLVQ